MDMIISGRNQILILALVGLLLFSTPATAGESPVTRSFYPDSPEPGGLVTVTLSLPPAFFGGIVERLPAGFSFVETSHPMDGVVRNGQTVIFAITGEDVVQYSMRVPSSGCGAIQGTWEDLGGKNGGEIPPTGIAVAGTDPSSCARPPHASGLNVLFIAAAGIAIALMCSAWKVR